MSLIEVKVIIDPVVSHKTNLFHSKLQEPKHLALVFYYKHVPFSKPFYQLLVIFCKVAVMHIIKVLTRWSSGSRINLIQV